MPSPEDIRIVLPMAGKGQRFIDVGVETPKPLIEIEGMPMVQWATKSLPFFDRVPLRNIAVIFRSEHMEDHDIDPKIAGIFGPGVGRYVDMNSSGAMTSVLVVRERIDGQHPVLIMDCDIYLADPSFSEAILERDDIDGAVPVFAATGDKWSYSGFGDDHIINEIAEKKPISSYANIGLYFFSKGSDFVEYADKVLEEGGKDEYYISAVIDAMIKDGKKFLAVEVNPKDFHNLGTPEDLEKFRIRGARSFNKIDVVDSNVLIKSSENVVSLHQEYLWYLGLPKALSCYAPKVFGFEYPKFADVDQVARLAMENYGYTTLDKLWVGLEVWDYRWKLIIQRLLDVTKEFRRYPGLLDWRDFDRMYVYKTIKRVRTTLEQGVWNSLLGYGVLYINGIEYRGWLGLYADVLNKAGTLYKKDQYTIIHGDFHLGNILYDLDTRVVKLLDPRGCFGQSGIYGDCKYDLAKLRHSIHGGYNHIVNDLVGVSQDGNILGSCFVRFQGWREIVKWFDEQLAIIGKEEFDDGNFLSDIRFIEGLLFLSMLPLHAGHPKRQLAMFAQAIVILNEEIDCG